jgi:glutathione synthase/RimK-type ligase-like ATP-grasp enzyme
MRIALATAAHLPELSEDDHILYTELLRRGFDAEPVIWDSGADWSRYQVVITRSIWDYHRKYDQFLKWLDALDASGACLFNPTPLERWNSDKHYMLDLEARGVRITPTRVIDRGAGRTLASVIEETGWTRIVVKPTVASTGFETWQADTPLTPEHEARFAKQSGEMDVLVQQFVPGIGSGERSFVFIGGEFTHCVLKKSAGEDFRVHIEWGGSVERVFPSTAEIDWARSVMQAVDQPWMYGRVDAVKDDTGQFVLMELEMLEPELFFAYNSEATDWFIEQIAISCR